MKMLDLLLRRYEAAGEIVTYYNGSAYYVCFVDDMHEEEIKGYCFEYAKRICGYYQTSDMADGKRIRVSW